MGTKDKRVEAYISNAGDFAKPILRHIRELVHQACPDVVETMKWSFPNFEHRGILCSMAAFKEHCAFNFWKARLMNDPQKRLSTVEKTSMGNFGRLRTLEDLPPDSVLIAYIKEAARLNEGGTKVPRKSKPAGKKKLVIPRYFKLALGKNRKALATFDEFSNSHKQEYLDWITEAKTEETRNKRMATAIEWLSEGKPRNWKYLKK